ncbi:MAG: hypothetical protein WKF75_20420 [Singulisphaera sp.]
MKAEPTEDVLKAHFSGGSIVGLFVLDDSGFCRLFVVDIDRHDEAGSPEANEKAAIAFFDRAVSMGFSAFLEDSNGRGGYKLWLIFKSPSRRAGSADISAGSSATGRIWDLNVSPKSSRSRTNSAPGVGEFRPAPRQASYAQT